MWGVMSSGWSASGVDGASVAESSNAAGCERLILEGRTPKDLD